MYILPQPKKLIEKQGSFFLAHDTKIVLTSYMKNGLVYAGILADCAEKWTGYTLAVVKGQSACQDILLETDAALSKQEYTISITEKNICIKGGDGAGVLYGVQSLCQMLGQCGSVLPCVEIQDAPDLLHRGYYLDQTRGRVMTLPVLKQVVDKLCRYKINELQLYVEHTYMFAGMSEMWRDETPLSAEEIMELDAYCAQRHVELIPSLSSFGHLYMLLSTKTYGDLCEMENSWQQPFSFLDRMRHHTVNVTDDRVLPMIKNMLSEYMELFTSDKFNFCADETFDLGKGKAKALADRVGVHRIYIDYVKELCNFLVEKGKTPMFWGDVIAECPELIKELPKEVICLTWGYAPDQREDESRKMAQLGAKQYLCPGVQGWNRWINHTKDAYENVYRMCTYAKKYGTIGVMNTDWGDYGHVNSPEYAIPGMIYGAAFSWGEMLPFAEMNRRISKVEYHDNSETLVSLIAEIPDNLLFEWYDTIIYYERAGLGEQETQLQSRCKALSDGNVEKANARLQDIAQKIKETVVNMDSSERKILKALTVTLQGLMIWNDIGNVVLNNKITPENKETCYKLAEALEVWYMYYKSLWRETSREGDLHHVTDVIFWYADLLRGRKREQKRIK